MIRLVSPHIPEEDRRAVDEVLASGWLVQGKHVARFEAAVAGFLGVEHAVAVSSGTAALHAALRAHGVGPGDAVAVPAYSHVASANVIELCGAEPIFIDIDPHTFNMDPGELERIVDGADIPIKAVLVVHAFGQMADIDAIGAIADSVGAPLVEDAACALGASRAGKQPGEATSAACFSFHPRKAITTGEGGMVATNDDAIARAVRTFRNHGQDPGSAPPDFVAPGLNYRMTEFQAVLGAAALPRLKGAIESRREIAARYDALLADCVAVPLVSRDSEPVFQSYVVLLPAEVAVAREELIADLAAAGIETTIGTWSIPTTTYYRERYGYVAGSYPVTSDVFERSLAIPMHENLGQEDQSRVANALRAAVSRLLEAAK